MSDEPGRVFRLIYSSHSRIESDDATTELGAIFTTARRNNQRLGITGALITTDDAFVQALEGDEAAVRELYESISHDPRHEQVTLIEAGDVDARTFGRWAMARVAEDGGPDIRLLSNAAKGRIVAAGPDGHVTDEQERVLGFMRGSIAAPAG
jgi:Sensors of blue-light using FAD